MDVAAIPGVMTLNPPASAEAIAGVSRSLHAPLPDEYATLLAQADGVVADHFILYGCEELPERNATFSIGECLPEFVAVGDDNGGSAIVTRGGPGPSPVFLVGYGALFPDFMMRVADSLAEWVAAGCP